MSKEIFLDDKIFIAGASGMVGSAINRKLINEGYGQEKHKGKIFINWWGR